MTTPSTDTDPTTAGPDAGKVDGAAKKSTGRKRTSSARDKAPKAPRSPGRPSNKAKRAEAVGGIYLSLGLALDMGGSMTGSTALQADGAAVVASAQSCGEAWAELAETNAQVARWLDGLSQSNAAGVVILAHLPIAQAIMANHPIKRPEPAPDLAETAPDLGPDPTWNGAAGPLAGDPLASA